MSSNAALARPNGVDTASTGVGDSLEIGSAAGATFAVPDALVDPLETASLIVGVGEGETTDSDFFLPPPKKLFKVCCFPLNSSRNLVANLGGSGTVLGGSVGYSGAVEGGRWGGLSRSLICSTSPDSVVIESWRSM